MHPVMNTKNLDRLPLPRRRVAMTALKAGRSLQELQQVVAAMKSSPSSKKELYLPVFHACLDPANIPTKNEWERLQPESDISTRVACASLALRYLFALLIGRDAARELGETTWPRVFQWVFFMHEYKNHLPENISLADEHLYTGNGAALCAVMSATLGFRVLVGRAWVYLSQMKASPAFEPCLHYIALFIGGMEYTEEEELAELVEGAGGTVDDLARLSVEFLDALRGNLSWELGPPGLYIHSLVSFIRGSRSSNPPDFSLRDKFIEALRAHGFIPSLVIATDSLSSLNDKPVVHISLELLETLMSTSGGYRLFPAAIHAGGNFPAQRSIITWLPPWGSVLEEVKKLVHTAEFEEEEIYDRWIDFLWTAEDRVKLVHRMKGRAVLKACDNLDVCVLASQTDISSLKFGSAEKSRMDRRADDVHGATPHTIATRIVKELTGRTADIVPAAAPNPDGDSPSCPLNYRERVFLRFVLQSDYQSSRTTVCTAQITHLRTSDSDQPFFILFNYRYCTPTPHSLELATDSKSGYTKNLQGPEWTNILARVRKSHGRMQLHVVNVVDGENDSLWVVPLRSSSAYIHKGVRELVSRIPDSEKYGALDVMKDIKEMLRGASDVVEIH
ncbi:hypothetical protein R3P38DRAFT_3575274 [Favolaschia claudopus]|uniref:Uncharacterized protein n=1 Tax=Favolaschia claudopus TaxID=2862362 RepID=A0AAW0AKX6_9AGAR